MRCILIDRHGFRKEMNVEHNSEIFQIAFMPPVEWLGDKPKAEQVVQVDRRTFYFERGFYDENEQLTKIYKEK
jgi:hypothetical protein